MLSLSTTITPTWHTLAAPPSERSQFTMPITWWACIQLIKQQERKLCDCRNVSLKHHGEKRPANQKALVCSFRALWRWSKPMTVPWQPLPSIHLAPNWPAPRRRRGHDFFSYSCFCFITYQSLNDHILLNRVLLSEYSAFLKDRGCLNSGEGWKGWCSHFHVVQYESINMHFWNTNYIFE